MAKDENGAVAAYAAQLERAILIAAAALRAGDVEYGKRVIWLIEGRIRSDTAAAEAEGATSLTAS